MEHRPFVMTVIAMVGLISIGVGFLRGVDEALWYLVPVWTRGIIDYSGMLPHHCATVAAKSLPLIISGSILVVLRKRIASLIIRLSTEETTQ